MSLSLPSACKVASTPQAFQRPNSIIPLTTTTPKLTPNTFSFPQCKPLSTTSTRSLVPHAVPSSGSKVGTAEKVSDKEKYKLSREEILKKLEVLEGKVEGLRSPPEKGRMADKNTNNGSATSASAQLEGILKESYALGLEVAELEGKNPSAETTTTILETILKEFNQDTSGRSRGDILEVTPQPNPGPTAEMIDLMVKEMVDAYYHKEPPHLAQLDGKYAPVRKETPPTEPLPVFIYTEDRNLPEELEGGIYLRVGPDPMYDPEANHKWADGHGMVHAVRFENGKAHYVSRYVKNSRYLQEKEFGKAQFFKYGDLLGAYGLFVAFIHMLRQRLNVLDLSFGYTTSNVGMVYHAGRLMALEDFGKPYALSLTDDGDLLTLGQNDYGGNLNHNFTPHPKKDARTGEMFIIALSHTAPYAIYRVINKDGTMRNAVPLTVKNPTYLHDLAITENYAIILDNPYLFTPEKMVTNDSWIFQFDATEKSRFGFLPRYATDESEMRWFEFEKSFFMFHVANAWEEDDGKKVVLYGCILDPMPDAKGNLDIHPLEFRNLTTDESLTPAPADLSLPHLNRITFDMVTGETTREILPNFRNTIVDFPKVNEQYWGRKSRYVYTLEHNEDVHPTGIVKYDTETNTQLSIGNLDSNLTFSETVFIPKKNPTAEDDGYIIYFIHTIDSAYAAVSNAQTMRVVVLVELPSRIPLGLHSIYVSKEELAEHIRTM